MADGSPWWARALTVERIGTRRWRVRSSDRGTAGSTPRDRPSASMVASTSEARGSWRTHRHPGRVTMIEVRGTEREQLMRTVATRLLRLVVVLFFVTLVTFLMIELLPGDPATALLGDNATPEQIDQVNEELGLNEPIVKRYFDWLGDTLTGDLGKSLVPPNADRARHDPHRMPVTLELVVLSTAMALLFSIPLALLTAYQAGEAARPRARAVSRSRRSRPRRSSSRCCSSSSWCSTPTSPAGLFLGLGVARRTVARVPRDRDPRRPTAWSGCGTRRARDRAARRARSWRS